MDIEEIREAKRALESQLRDDIAKFHAETQTTVERVELRHLFSDSSPQPVRTDVSVKVSLGVEQ